MERLQGLIGAPELQKFWWINQRWAIEVVVDEPVVTLALIKLE